jgi:hypothetical protein
MILFFPGTPKPPRQTKAGEVGLLNELNLPMEKRKARRWWAKAGRSRDEPGGLRFPLYLKEVSVR